MSGLLTSPRIGQPDEFYATLMDAVRGLDAEASLRFCARLVLLLANQIGDAEVLREAVRLAREGEEPGAASAGSGG
jgi:hypothetical protein